MRRTRRWWARRSPGARTVGHDGRQNPSIPATTTSTSAFSTGSRWASKAVQPGHATSKIRATRLPSSSAVTAASSGDGISPCPREHGDGAVGSASAPAELDGNRVARIFRRGRGRLHRLLAHASPSRRRRCWWWLRVLDGVLPTVVAGLFSRLVIAVPTSVGYGASMGGIAALLTMLNSCATGVAW